MGTRVERGAKAAAPVEAAKPAEAKRKRPSALGKAPRVAEAAATFAPAQVAAPAATGSAAPLVAKYDLDGDGKIGHADVLGTNGTDVKVAYQKLSADLSAAGLGANRWAVARALSGRLDASARNQFLQVLGGPALAEISSQTRGNARLGDSALALQRAVDALGVAGAGVAVGHLDAGQRRLLRDLDFMSYDKKAKTWTYRDPLSQAKPLFDSAALKQLVTKDSPGNATYAANGDLFTSIQSAGRNQPEVGFHLGKLDPATGKLVPYPSVEYQKSLGGVLGARVVPKPASLGGDGTSKGGELLVALDWKKSQFIAIDLATNKEVFREDLPNSLVQKILPGTAGALSMHNDFAMAPDGSFYISNPAAASIGVFKPNWASPSRSTFTEVLKDKPGTKGGETDLTVNGRRIKVELFKALGIEAEIPFESGVDSIAFTPDLKGQGPHLLFSPLTPDGAGKLFSVPLKPGDEKNIKGAIERAATHGLVRPVARVPINDGLTVATVSGRPYLFGTDVQGHGAFVMDLTTMQRAPLVRDARVGWADGMAVQVDEATGRLKVTFANSGLEKSLGGDAPPAADRGLFTLEVGIDDLLAKLAAQPMPSNDDQL